MKQRQQSEVTLTTLHSCLSLIHSPAYVLVKIFKNENYPVFHKTHFERIIFIHVLVVQHLTLAPL